MLKLKRIALLLAELLAEVVLLGCFLGAMVSDKIGPLKGVLGAMITIPVVLGLHGYYVSRLLTTIAWSSKAKWLYPGPAREMSFAAARGETCDETFASLSKAEQVSYPDPELRPSRFLFLAKAPAQRPIPTLLLPCYQVK